ncbi:MAG: Ig domain-containing protein, partial [Oscillospiraceae bacterium]|nr:Ig domain-containing protein [Oscillospiraceae bacterium]
MKFSRKLLCFVLAVLLLVPAAGTLSVATPAADLEAVHCCTSAPEAAHCCASVPAPAAASCCDDCTPVLAAPSVSLFNLPTFEGSGGDIFALRDDDGPASLAAPFAALEPASSAATEYPPEFIELWNAFHRQIFWYFHHYITATTFLGGNAYRMVENILLPNVNINDFRLASVALRQDFEAALVGLEFPNSAASLAAFEDGSLHVMFDHALSALAVYAVEASALIQAFFVPQAIAFTNALLHADYVMETAIGHLVEQPFVLEMSTQQIETMQAIFSESFSLWDNRNLRFWDGFDTPDEAYAWAIEGSAIADAFYAEITALLIEWGFLPGVLSTTPTVAPCVPMTGNLCNWSALPIGGDGLCVYCPWVLQRGLIPCLDIWDTGNCFSSGQQMEADGICADCRRFALRGTVPCTTCESCCFDDLCVLTGGTLGADGICRGCHVHVWLPLRGTVPCIVFDCCCGDRCYHTWWELDGSAICNRCDRYANTFPCANVSCPYHDRAENLGDQCNSCLVHVWRPNRGAVPCLRRDAWSGGSSACYYTGSTVDVDGICSSCRLFVDTFPCANGSACHSYNCCCGRVENPGDTCRACRLYLWLPYRGTVPCLTGNSIYSCLLGGWAIGDDGICWGCRRFAEEVDCVVCTNRFHPSENPYSSDTCWECYSVPCAQCNEPRSPSNPCTSWYCTTVPCAHYHWCGQRVRIACRWGEDCCTSHAPYCSSWCAERIACAGASCDHYVWINSGRPYCWDCYSVPCVHCGDRHSPQHPACQDCRRSGVCINASCSNAAVPGIACADCLNDQVEEIMRELGLHIEIWFEIFAMNYPGFFVLRGNSNLLEFMLPHVEQVWIEFFDTADAWHEWFEQEFENLIASIEDTSSDEALSAALADGTVRTFFESWVELNEEWIRRGHDIAEQFVSPEAIEFVWEYQRQRFLLGAPFICCCMGVDWQLEEEIWDAFVDALIEMFPELFYDDSLWEGYWDYVLESRWVEATQQLSVLNNMLEAAWDVVLPQYGLELPYWLRSNDTRVLVTGVTIAGAATRNLNAGQTLQLNATVNPTNATNRNVTWSSSNTAIATVNASGLVTARASGTATITVTTADGNRTASVQVTVTVPVTGVTIAGAATRNLNVNQTLQLNATVNPTNATNRAVTWSSSNTAIATVNASGLVTARASGTATITVTTADGNRTASVQVTVAVPVTGVTIAGAATRNLNVNQTLQLSATVNPTNATNRNVTWSSSNTAIATVNASGLVTARAAGTATITVTTADGNRTASVQVTVAVPVTSITIAGAATRTLLMGQTLQLSATVNPTNATNRAVTWSSSSTAVATVNANGLVTPVAPGTATITVRTADGNRTASVTVTVTRVQLTVNGGSGGGQFNVGANATITATPPAGQRFV